MTFSPDHMEHATESRTSDSPTRHRIFATANIGTAALARLTQLGYEVEVYPALEPPPKELIIARVRSGIAALITTLRDPIDREVIASGAGTLRVISQDAVGFNNIDRAAANEYRIPFTNTPDVLTEATAEFAFFMMGNVARKLYPSERLVIEDRWPSWHPSEPFLGDEVTGKTVAVIGLGRIGRAFAKKCVGFDMDLICYTGKHAPSAAEEQFLNAVDSVMHLRYETGLSPRRQTIQFADLSEALGRADYVSLHVPLTMPGTSSRPTFHMMGAAEFKQMKSSAYLVNTSRGPVVDELALYEALINDEIAGAALDVFEVEPLPADSPLRDERLHLKLRMFHHFASGARDTRLSPDPNVGMAGRCVQGVIDVLQGNYQGDPRLMPYVVNKEAF